MHTAKREKNDEFYTLYEDIEKELRYYHHHFKDKVVYCNCDSTESNFFKYFKDNFNTLGLQRLIISDVHSHTTTTYDGEITLTTQLNSGDFRSEECVELLKECDIVVTNPPFSLFREFIATLEEYGKKYLVIGNMNAITYKEIFPLLKDGKMWLGKHTNKTMSFQIPNEYERFNYIENGLKFGKVPAISWFTNLDNNKQSELLSLISTYNEEKYPKYDNYDAINVDKVKDIPYDYEGVIGVPITILNYLCSDGLIHFDAPLKREREREYIELSSSAREQTRRICQSTERHPISEYSSNLQDNWNRQICGEQSELWQEVQNQQQGSLCENPYTTCYRVVGAMTSTKVTENNYGYPYINGQKIYARILIQVCYRIVGLGIANLGLSVGVKPYKEEHRKYRKEVQKRGVVDGDLYMVINNKVEVPYARVLIQKV